MMMRVVLSLMLLLAMGSSVPRATELDCTPQRDSWLAVGVAGQEIVPDSRTPDERPNGGDWPADVTTNRVPPDEIWIIKNVSIGQHGAAPNWAPRQYAIQIQRFWSFEPVSFWSSGVALCVNSVTPLCSFTPDRGLILEPYERLTARASGAPEGAISIMSFGWRVPKACRPKALGLQ